MILRRRGAPAHRPPERRPCRDRRLLLALAPVGLLLALALSGCNDGEGSTTSASAEAEATAEASATAAATAAAIQLERFEYKATLTLRESGVGQSDQVVVSTDGFYQAPDRHSFTYSTQVLGATLSESLVLIGDDAWVRDDISPWRMTGRDDARVNEVLSTAFTAVRPDFLGGREFEEARVSIRRIVPANETVNGIPADRYTIGEAGEEFFRSFLANERITQARDLKWDLWLAQDGAWPVRLVVSGTISIELPILQRLDMIAPTAWELRIDVSRPNDETIAVTPPDA